MEKKSKIKFIGGIVTLSFIFIFVANVALGAFFPSLTLFDIKSQLDKIQTSINKLRFGNSEVSNPEEGPVLGGGFFLGRCPFTVSTSTGRYLTGSDATTSPIVCRIDGADMIDLNIQLTASSSTSTLRWQVEFSSNGGDWYAEDGKTITSNTITTHGESPKLHVWTPNTTATTTKNVGIEPLSAKFIRVFFNMSPQTDNGAVWAEIVKREQFRR